MPIPPTETVEADEESQKKCANCGKEFISHRRRQEYCSRDCYLEHNRQVAHEEVPRHLRGTLSELFVCTDLLRRGFEVYRNVSAYGSLDLMAYGLNGKILRVEVTSGRITHDGNLYYERHTRHKERRDVIAVVVPEKILYIDNDGNDVQPSGKKEGVDG
jgi:hypothetical protein